MEYTTLFTNSDKKQLIVSNIKKENHDNINMISEYYALVDYEK